MKDLTLIIPAKFEKDSLPIVIKELEKYDVKKMIVLQKDDHQTINAISNSSCEIVFQKKLGYGSALIEGINRCKTKYLCIFNADGSFDPKELNGMYDLLKNNQAVFGSRYKNKSSGSDDDTLVTLIGNKIFTLIGNLFLKIKISDILYTYFIANTDLMKSLKLNCADFRICVEIPLKIQKSKASYCDFASYERRRKKGFKKVNEFKDGFLILIYILKSIF